MTNGNIVVLNDNDNRLMTTKEFWKYLIDDAIPYYVVANLKADENMAKKFESHNIKSIYA